MLKWQKISTIEVVLEVVENVSQGEAFWEKVRICLLLNDFRADIMQSRPTNLSRHHRLQTGLCALHSNPKAKIKDTFYGTCKSKDCFINRLNALLISLYMTKSKVCETGL